MNDKGGMAEMKVRGSISVVKALEDEGVRFTFGIPGTHNIELYDALEDSRQIQPILVTDEQSASFMADAVSRTTGTIGVVNTVPGAGVTHALSGIAEAFMDNIPLLVLTCGIRTDTGKSYQLHDIDQLAILRPVCKEVFHVVSPQDIYHVIRNAIHIARSQTPGPVAVEIPMNHYLKTHDIPSFDYNRPPYVPSFPTSDELYRAAEMLNESKRPAIYAGYGARNTPFLLYELAEKLCAPVVTTIQGKGVFPESHELFLWNGFGNSSPSFVRRIMDHCDCLLAIGCRFGEVATASFGINPPENMLHVDINPEVHNANYHARLPIVSDAGSFLRALSPLVERHDKNISLISDIAAGHKSVVTQWANRKSKKGVTPWHFFSTLQKYAAEDAIYTTDSGNGTFLGMEMLRLEKPGLFLGPIDYSCMGYAVPAAIGAKLANPDREVIALAGDGALLMTGLELLTAANMDVAPVVFVLRDRNLSQISQLQRFTHARQTCTILPDYSARAFANAVNSRYYYISSDAYVEKTIPQALAAADDGKPVVVEVAIDYSTKTFFTKGVLKTNFLRLPWSERVRMTMRSGKRRLAKRQFWL
jgi:acetolactate synthase-1/2/3 large subunit